MKKTDYTDAGLFVLRVISGSFMLFGHGWSKLMSFSERFHHFSDPLGLGQETSFILVLVAEVVCAALLIAGYFTRYALVPLIINFIVIAFVVQGSAGFGKQELPLLYLAIYITLFLTGPGKYALDARR